jgi:hypothetical protein
MAQTVFISSYFKTRGVLTVQGEPLSDGRCLVKWADKASIYQRHEWHTTLAAAEQRAAKLLGKPLPKRMPTPRMRTDGRKGLEGEFQLNTAYLVTYKGEERCVIAIENRPTTVLTIDVNKTEDTTRPAYRSLSLDCIQNVCECPNDDKVDAILADLGIDE